MPGPAVVGLPTSEQLHLVTINVDSVTDTDTHETKSTAQSVIHDINDLKRAYPQQFDTVGDFTGEAKFMLKDDAEGFIDAPRKCNIHMKDNLKQELQNMVSQGVLRKVDEHKDSCSSLAYSTNNPRMHRPTATQRSTTQMSSQNTHIGVNQTGTC